MRKFKEIVSFLNPTDKDQCTSIKIKHDRPYMRGTVVSLSDKIVTQTTSQTTSVYGIVLKSSDDESYVITSGITYCLCKSSLYKKGDYIRVCEYVGVGSKYGDISSFHVSDNIKSLDSFAIVEESVDLRTMYIGFVKVRLINVPSI